MALRPQKRTKLRIALGRVYYTLLRYIKWYFGGTRFAKTRRGITYPVVVFRHRTPLIRKLKDVEMWLQYNKVKTLAIAVEKVNGVVINPGETFSFWKLIGRPTKRKGYADGMVLLYGGFRPGIGGGLCQLSNLIYWMTLHTPLTVTERHRHSYDVFPDSNRTQPFGSGATCVYNYIDLQVKNDTGHPYRLCVRLTDEYLEGEWRTLSEPEYCYEVYEKEHSITHEIWGGYVRHNVISRRVYRRKTGDLVGDEYITENHAVMMYQPFLKEGSGIK
ncbi:MAG TPA: VanW family protein [Bacillota bacterium]|nr:VanW family protein [Bacillota bacterium]